MCSILLNELALGMVYLGTTGVFEGESGVVGVDRVILCEDAGRNRTRRRGSERVLPALDVRVFQKMRARVLMRQDAGARLVTVVPLVTVALHVCGSYNSLGLAVRWSGVLSPYISTTGAARDHQEIVWNRIPTGSGRAFQNVWPSANCPNDRVSADTWITWLIS